MSEKLRFDLPALLSLHRFGDIYERAIAGIESDRAAFEVLRQAPDSIGPHWYGMRVRVTSLTNGESYYLHTGLIFLPQTKIGLMVEVDRKNNLHSYADLVARLEDGPLFTVNRAEEEYLKLFMPDGAFARMNRLGAAEQQKMLADYMKACAEAIVGVSDGLGFSLTEGDLLDAYGLARAFRKVIEDARCPDFQAEINDKDPDNFGQYAMGYRYYLSNRSGSARMYAYFGAIYSYKKRPAGLFAEIDWFSNQDCFDHVKAHFVPNDHFVYSDREEKFIKLFMPEPAVERFNAAGAEEQLALLEEFFVECSRALALASEK